MKLLQKVSFYLLGFSAFMALPAMLTIQLTKEISFSGMLCAIPWWYELPVAICAVLLLIEAGWKAVLHLRRAEQTQIGSRSSDLEYVPDWNGKLTDVIHRKHGEPFTADPDETEPELP
jgi:hypothetical protein